MRTCDECERELHQNSPYPTCKVCRRIRGESDRYAKVGERQKVTVKLNPDGTRAEKPWMRERRLFFEGLKDRSCADCGGRFPHFVMDWDHRPGEVKLFNISYAKSSFARERVVAEIAKCDLVCANCHRIRTAREGGWSES